MNSEIINANTIHAKNIITDDVNISLFQCGAGTGREGFSDVNFGFPARIVSNMRNVIEKNGPYNSKPVPKIAGAISAVVKIKETVSALLKYMQMYAFVYIL